MCVAQILEMDTDGDGEVTFLEYMSWYSGKSKLQKRILQGVAEINKGAISETFDCLLTAFRLIHD